MYNKKGRRTQTKEKKPSSLALKVFRYFAAFTAFVLVFLWLFQIVFLDDIYRVVKLGDMKNCADSVCSYIEDEDVENGVVASPGEWIKNPAFIRMEKGGIELVSL